MKALIPTDPNSLTGPFIEADVDRFDVRAITSDVVLLDFFAVPEGITWFDDFELMYCQRQHDPNVVKVIRKATDEEWKLYRVPLWVQGEHEPECCGQPMFFVGQIDDDRICMERPEGAKLWWHDAASFYVFTCSQCMECKAFGDQL
ncbi:MAG: hypothetical protein AAGA29_01800 [Planctomycetota bacterium]